MSTRRKIIFWTGHALAFSFVAGFVLWLALAAVGCSTVVPQTVSPTAASYDGNEQTSGVLGATANGFIVTSHFRDRYNALVATYGRDFTVPIKAGEGLTAITDTRWLIDRQHLSQFLEMNEWSRAGLKPRTP